MSSPLYSGASNQAQHNGSADYELSMGCEQRSREDLKSCGIKYHSCEDGFIRSKGLGANFHLPLSLVFDDIGIYYDARSPSRLEQNLNSAQYSPEQLSEARELCQFLCENKITKYQLWHSKMFDFPQKPPARRSSSFPAKSTPTPRSNTAAQGSRITKSFSRKSALSTLTPISATNLIPTS